MATRSGMVAPRFGGGRVMSASVTLPSASAIAWLMRRQLTRTPQWGSWSQAPAWALHSVMPIGPSIATTTSAMVMRSGGRARL